MKIKTPQPLRVGADCGHEGWNKVSYNCKRYCNTLFSGWLSKHREASRKQGVGRIADHAGR